ncbi:MAG: hypothetical protein WBJ23_07300 [Anaerolineaceae bacterium]|jgi:hypothetical protein
MFFSQSPIFHSLLDGLLVELIVTITGVLFARTILKWWINWRYGRWTITIKHANVVKLDKIPITPEKIKQVTDIPEDMPVFLKGMCSPYKILRCDLMREGVELGGLIIDDQKREIIIDLDLLPEPTNTPLNL